MEQELNLLIVLESPPQGVVYSLQKGGGNNYERLQTQTSTGKELKFEFSVRVGKQKNGQPNFLGPFTQGPADKRFVYLDIGAYAGQIGSLWSRRLKIPLHGITWELINKGKTLVAQVPGKAKDGSPSCATVKPFRGWEMSDML
jgi:hypothetical protein